MAPSSGKSPDRVDGTDRTVLADTLVALRYQVPAAASRAKLGKRCWLIVPSSRRRLAKGSSSNMTKTTGASPPTRTSASAPASPAQKRSPVAEVNRKRARKNTGAKPR